MYESPIDKIYGDIESKIVQHEEGQIMYAVEQAIGYAVDKEELVKALTYDRKQYERGFEDGKQYVLSKIGEIFNGADHF